MIHRTLLVLLLATAVPTAGLDAQAPSSEPVAGATASEPAPEATPEAPPEGAPPRPDPCAAEPFHQFDFWLGEWDVHGARGGPPGRNSITSLHGGCVIQESYQNGRYSGMSMNYYDQAEGTWNQLWIDNGGLVLRLSGSWNGDSMVLANDESRITWTPAEDGTVRQLWEQTEDGGETWDVVFDGKYVRRTGGE